MQGRIDEKSSKRVQIVWFVLLAWALIIVCRLVQLQIFRHDEFLRRAQDQTEKIKAVPAVRGAILDRDGGTLARTLPLFAVGLDPKALREQQQSKRDSDRRKYREAIETLTTTLHLAPGQVESQMAEALAKSPKSRYLLLKRQVPVEDGVALKKAISKLGLYGIQFGNDYLRTYPKNSLASHLLGGMKDYELWAEDDLDAAPCKTDCNPGRGGIEYKFNEDLAGKPGRARVMRANTRVEVDEQIVTPAQPGYDLTLTIQSEIQSVAEREIAAAVEKSGAEGGTVVVMDPHTGDVLAIAQSPTFDPNGPVRPGEEKNRELRAVTQAFEPGSVFKVITLAAAMEAGRVRLTDPIDCHLGLWKIGKRVIHDDHRLGVVPASEVLVKSSNLGSIELARRAGKSGFEKYVAMFGIGEKTGLEVAGESSGEYLVRYARRNAEGRVLPPAAKEMTDDEMTSIAFGHNVSTTSMQLARACSIVANGGLRVEPRLLLKRQRPGQKEEILPRPAPVRVLRGETALDLQQTMRRVVISGTAHDKVHLPGYSAAGKTGTAKRIMKVGKKTMYVSEYNASFMGFAPANQPRVVAVVTLFRTRGTSGYGGQIAAPVFEKVVGAALRVLQVRKDLPEVEDQLAKNERQKSEELAARPTPTTEPVKTILPVRFERNQQIVDLKGMPTPDFRGKSVREVMRLATQAGVPVELDGSGLAQTQAPAPGQWLTDGAKVVIRFGQ